MIRRAPCSVTRRTILFPKVRGVDFLAVSLLVPAWSNAEPQLGAKRVVFCTGEGTHTAENGRGTSVSEFGGGVGPV